MGNLSLSHKKYNFRAIYVEIEVKLSPKNFPLSIQGCEVRYLSIVTAAFRLSRSLACLFFLFPPSDLYIFD